MGRGPSRFRADDLRERAVKNRRQTGVLAVLLLVVAIVCGCSEVTPTPIVVTRVVKVTPVATVEPTATSTPGPTTTETPFPTFTPRPTFTRSPTRTPKPTATPTPSMSMEEWQAAMGEAIVSDLESMSDVTRVNLVRWNTGLVAIELQTTDPSTTSKEWAIGSTLSVWITNKRFRRASIIGVRPGVFVRGH